MKIIKPETNIEGLFILEPKIFRDARGYFFESYNRQVFFDAGIDIPFVQDNQSKSEYGVIRGLHFQKEPFAQTKLVRVLEGAIYDVAVDLRNGSPTFGQWYGLEITSENGLQLLIPKGFAHG
ncbi:MAG: dTDP-4-dehydrorhamnose 3,5-epimerase, partial [Bacteroidales bacterium]|nr:dTDP-4-dehydrorhamnose 3,5-epimerase [Bacteroidales bacterium]